MKTTYVTVVIGHGKHASIEIPQKNLDELGANNRDPLKTTINGYTYQSTATGVDGKCTVVFPSRDREASGAVAGDTITVTLELDSGYRQVVIPSELAEALSEHGFTEKFKNLTYSKRKEYCRLIAEAKGADTKQRRLDNIVNQLRS